MSSYRQISTPEILQQVLSCCFDTEVYTAVSYGEWLHGPKPCSDVSHRGGPASFFQGSVSTFVTGICSGIWQSGNILKTNVFDKSYKHVAQALTQQERTE